MEKGTDTIGRKRKGRQVNVTHRGRILIVDDEPKIGSFIGRALTAAGYTTAFACTGADALRSHAISSYDLVILDLVIGDIDGRQLLGQLLTARPDQAVIVLSCVADIAAKVDLLERGAQDYLTKPFSLAELLARVRVRLRAEPHHAEQHHGGHQHARCAGRPSAAPAAADRSAAAPGAQRDHQGRDVTLDIAGWSRTSGKGRCR